jgi:hypothetical protein
MSKEQQELVDEAYKNYQTEWLKENPPFSGPYTNKCLTQEEFINKIKTDPEFSEKWGLKIEERELIEKERYQIFDERGYEFMMNNWSKEEQYNKAGIPTKLITVKYNDTTIESYE